MTKSSSFNATTERTACYYVCASIRQNCSHCPRIYRGFPCSLGCYFHFILLYPYPSSPKYWLLSRRIVLTFCACVCFVFLNNFWPSHNLKWDNRMSERLKDNVNGQCESSHGAAGQFKGLILTEIICGSPASRPLWHDHCLLRQKAWDFPYIHLAC